MRGAVALLSAASLICGLMSAWYWYKASSGYFEPQFDKIAIDAPESDFSWALIRAIMKATAKAGRANRKAALWTAATIALGTMSGFLGMLGSN
jgi:hypothetical protein